MSSHCFLCGITLRERQARRYQPTKDLQQFVRTSCHPTPLAFAFITENEHFCRDSPVCIPCINWKRRTCLKSCKTHLQVDQLMSYILQPGRMSEIDQRCLTRLLDALLDGTSPFASVIPMPVRSILSRLEAHDFVSITKAWWDFNGHTRFFRHTQTARIVRAIQKGDEPVDELVPRE